MNSEISAVERVAMDYLEALHAGDTAGLERAFAPDASLYASLGGKADSLPLAAWLDRVRGRASAEASGHPNANRVLSIDVTGDMALAKVVSAFPPRRFTDYLSMIRLDGGWRIIAKTYTVENL